MMPSWRAAPLLLALLLAAPVLAQAEPHQVQARALLADLVAFRTSAGRGQVPAMAGHIARVLQDGGVPEADIATLPVGETVAMLVRVPGRDRRAKPLLFSAHMDVVDARPEDWQRDPYRLVEADGFLYGRGADDNKTGVVALVSTILRLTAAGAQPKRTLVFAFVGDEETEQKTTVLIAAHPWVKGAAYAINTDGGGGTLSAEGRPLIYYVQTGEKAYATFKVTARNPGGHSSAPRADNAIYDLARALLRIEAITWPVMATPLTRRSLAAAGAVAPEPMGGVLRRFAKDPDDAAAIAAIRANPGTANRIATTCVATMLNGGHGENALPQRAEATVNCRIFPGTPVAEVRDRLAAAAGTGLQVETIVDTGQSLESELPADVLRAIAQSVAREAPGVVVAPALSSGASDGLVYRAAGIPTFATTGMFTRPGESNAHGENERVRVTNFHAALAHVHELALALGGVKP